MRWVWIGVVLILMVSGALAAINKNVDGTLGIVGNGENLEWIDFLDSSQNALWHINHYGGGLNFANTGQADYRLFLKDGDDKGGYVGINCDPTDVGRELVICDGDGNKDTRLHVITKNGDSEVLTQLISVNDPGNRGAYGLVGTSSKVPFYVAAGGKGIIKVYPPSQKKGIEVNGNIEKTGSNDFVIPHPTKPGYELVHASLEGPEAGVYYRGRAKLEDGKAVIQLPGYFEALTRKENRTVLLTPIGGWAPLYVEKFEDGSVIKDGKFIVKLDNRFALPGMEDQEFFWEVKAIRADIPPLQVERKAQ